MQGFGGALAIIFGLGVILAGLGLIYRFYLAGRVQNANPAAPDALPDSAPAQPQRRYSIPSDFTPQAQTPAPVTSPSSQRKYTTLNLPKVQIPSFLNRQAVSKPNEQPLSAQQDRIQRLRDMRQALGREYIAPIDATHQPAAGEVGSAGGHGFRDEILQRRLLAPEEMPTTAAQQVQIVQTPSEGVQGSEDADTAPPDMEWRGGSRDVTTWREAQNGYAMRPRRRGILLPALVGAGTILLVGLVIWLLAGQQNASAALPPGAAVIVVADFGEGPDYQDSAAGRNAADTLRKETQARANNSKLVVRAVGRITNGDQALQEMRRQNAQALLWGTLPDGASGAISATLTWRTTPPADPWLRYGPTGRMSVPLQTSLPDQPLIAGAALAPLLNAILQYQGGYYDAARRAAEGAPGNAPAATINVAGFIRANALLAAGQVDDALALYTALDARGWRPDALYNNWGLALSLSGDQQNAAATLNKGLAIEPPPYADNMALLHANRAAVAQASGDRTLAKAEFQEALKLKTGDQSAQLFAEQQLGFMFYQEGDAANARLYSQQALALAPDNPYTQRNLGLITMMDRQPAQAQALFQQALATLDGWARTLRLRASSSDALGDTGGAVQANEQVRAINFERGTSEYFVGLSLADQAADAAPENFLQGLVRRLQGRKSLAEQAIDAFQQAITLDQDREDARYQMGVLYRRQGDAQQAQTQFARAKELNPRAAGSYEQLADMYVQAKRLDKAATEYETLLTQNPGYLKGYIELAQVYSAGNNPDAARQTYQRALTVQAVEPRDNLYRAQAAYALYEANTADTALLNQASTEALAATADPSVWEAHLLLGQIYLLTNQPDAALDQYNMALAQQPDNVDALYATGKLLAASGQTDKALEAWNKVVALKPRYPGVHLDLGQLYAAMQPPKLDQAISEYKAAIDVDSSKADPYLRLGDLYGLQSDWQNAASSYQEAIKRNIDLVEAWQGLTHAQLRQPGKDSDALQTAHSFQQHAPGDARAYLLLGEVFLARNDSSAAIDNYQQALRLNPGNAEAYYGQGRAYAMRGDSNNAGQYFDAALAAKPDYPAALSGKGDLFFDAGRYGEALDEYSRALQIDQNFAPAFYGWGRVIDKTATQPADTQEAINKLNRAIQLDPNYAEPHEYLGDMYASRAQDDAGWNKAIAEYNQSAKLRPAWALPQFRLGQIYLSRQKLPEAIAAFTQATKNDPNLIEGWFNLAQAERAAGKRKEAITHYQQAISLNNNYANAWLNLGYTLEEDGQRNAAVDAFGHARDTSADQPEIRAAAEQALKRYQ